MNIFCGNCKYWQKGSVYSHGSYIYGHCCNTKTGSMNVITEYDDSCDNHSHQVLMEKRAVVKEDEKVTPIVKEAMEKLLEEEKKNDKKPQYVLGADPGKHGGIVLIDINNHLNQLHFPTKVKDGRVDIETMFKTIYPFKDSLKCAVKEEIHAIFGSSASSTFEFGAADGALEAFLKILSNSSENKFPVYTVQPKAWQSVAWKGVELVKGDPIMDKGTKKQKVTKKGELRFKTDTKATSMAAAHALFPGVSFIPPRCRNEHDGLIDAALIAYWGIKKHVK